MLATRLMVADGWSLGQPGAYLTLEATSGEPAGRSLSQLVSRPGAATVAYGAQSLLYNVLRMQGASASADVPRFAVMTALSAGALYAESKFKPKKAKEA